MRIAVHQPNYLPWTGFFHKQANCDTLVILDNVQYPRRDYCNRTLIKGQNGPVWLSLPVVRGPVDQKISQVKLYEPAKCLYQHWETIHHTYARAPYYNLISEKLKPIYTQAEQWLSALNLALIKVLAEFLEITTPLVLASSLGEPPPGKNERIIYLCRELKADTYLSGQGGAAYNDPMDFDAAGICLEYQKFQPPAYTQGNGDFIPNLSVVDLLMYKGPASRHFITLNGRSKHRF